MKKKIEAIIRDINEAMPVQAPDKVLKDVDDCYREILNKHLT